MQDYAVSPSFDVAANVSHSTTLHGGTIIYRFSRELLAYLETLVAFSPYCHEDDPRSAAHIDKHFKSALTNYKDISYEQLHEYLTELLTEWYEENPPVASSKRLVSSLEEEMCLSRWGSRFLQYLPLQQSGSAWKYLNHAPR
jgi:hypothetical protein